MNRLLRNGSSILLGLAALLLAANIYSTIALGIGLSDPSVVYDDPPDKLGLLLKAVVNGLWLAALPFFGACILYHAERWKGRGE